MFSLLPYAKKYRKEIILGPFFKFLEAVFELLLPLLMARLIDQGLNKNNPQVVFKQVILMLLLSIAGMLSAIICQYFASISSQGFGTELRNALMKKIHHFSYGQLDFFGPETLTTRLTNDITQVQTALAMFIRLFVRAPFLSIGSVFMAFYLNWRMGLIFLIVLPIFTVFLYLITKFSVPLYGNVQKKLDQFNSQLSENLTGIQVIRAFGKSKKMTERTKDTSDSLEKAYEKVANLSALLSPLTSFILNIGILVILKISGQFVNNGTLPQGEVLALINYMSQMLLALIVVSNLVVLFTRAQASAVRVNEVLKSENPLVKDKKEIIENEELLSFQDVSFRYTPKSGFVLKNIHFSLKKGETLGVIGATGSGKSSLIPLIMHEYEATKGTVSFFKEDVVTLNHQGLLEKIAWVPQKAQLFSGSIRDNLSFGKYNPTNEECFKALEIAQLKDFVLELPEQLDTILFEGGQNLSGGQKQRLTIARALMKEPSLLILDDSLSALDYETDLKLRQSLQKNLPDTGILLISQRISSLTLAEKILLLDEGNQVGLGDFSTLLKENPTFKKIYASQQEVLS